MIRIEGFLVYQFSRRAEVAHSRLTWWVLDGRLKYREDIVEGLSNASKTLIGMMHGANFGKLLVKVSEE